MQKRIAILGSTGSIGTQALEVIAANPRHFQPEVIVARKNAGLLISQAKKYKPNAVVIADETQYEKVKTALEKDYIKVYTGIDSVNQIVEMESVDMVLTALVGYAGLLPTIKAIKAGKQIALANKETLVVAGELITRLAIENKVSILPVDSEHSAIFQCLTGELDNEIEKIYLTASGGPFRKKPAEELPHVTREQALNHPNWNMGNKITIDSATLINKGFEVIEAKWLFGLMPSQIDVIVHPQSIIHSIVQFTDGSMKAQMGLPDMKLPIQYAMTFPKRLKSDFPRFDFTQYPNLSFEKADQKKFRNLALAFEVLEKGGNMPCVLNASNEIAVEAFLNKQIKFTYIPAVIEETLNLSEFISSPGYEDYVFTNDTARKITLQLIKKIK